MNNQKIKIELRSKHPHKTLWVGISYRKKSRPPKKLIDDFVSRGWYLDPLYEKLPKNYNGCFEAVLYKDGSDTFRAWNKHEQRQNREEIFDVLRENNIELFYRKRLTVMDMI